MSSDEYKTCPTCASQLKSALLKCIYCKTLLKYDPDKDLSLIENCTIAWLDGNYNGEVLADKPYGYGVFTSPKGIKYSGEWIDGKPHGKGKFTDKNGGLYIGDYKNGKRDGLGKYNSSDGKKYEGEWENGKFIRPIAKTTYFETNNNGNLDYTSTSTFGKDARETLEHYMIGQQYDNKSPDTNKWWVWLVVIILSIIITVTTMSPFFSIIAGLILLVLGLINTIKPLSFISIHNRGVALLILSAGLMILFFGTSVSLVDMPFQTRIDVNEIRESAKEIPYDELARYPSTYKGAPVIQKGKIIQKISDTSFRVNITKGNYGIWSDTIYARLYGEARDVRLLEDDIIVFIGIAQGEITYESIIGRIITIPRIDVYDVKLIR